MYRRWPGESKGHANSEVALARLGAPDQFATDVAAPESSSHYGWV